MEAPSPVNPEKLISEARARIMWGESQDEVRECLAEQGLDTMGIDEVLRACIAERGALVRKRAIIEIMAGLGLIVMPTSVLLVLWFVIGIMISGVFAAGIAISLYGTFRLLRGIGWMTSGANFHGSIADLGEGWF